MPSAKCLRWARNLRAGVPLKMRTMANAMLAGATAPRDCVKRLNGGIPRRVRTDDCSFALVADEFLAHFGRSRRPAKCRCAPIREYKIGAMRPVISVFLIALFFFRSCTRTLFDYITRTRIRYSYFTRECSATFEKGRRNVDERIKRSSVRAAEIGCK